MYAFTFPFLVLAGPVVAGYIFDADGSYLWAGVLTGVPLLLSLFFLARMWRIYNKELRGSKNFDDAADREVTKDINSSHQSYSSDSGSGSSSEDKTVKPATRSLNRKSATEHSRLLGSVV